jgi:hypothetical protein
MGVLQKLPDDSLFLPTVNLFTATYNTPTPGYYDWGVAANVGQTVLGISPGFLYFISILNFGATIAESDYLQNLSTIPRVQFLTKLTGRGLYGGGYPIGNYLKNNDMGAYFWTGQNNDSLIATFTGVLAQSASLAGVPSITANVSLNAFQIVDKAYIEKFFGLTGADPRKAGAMVLPADLERRV